MSLGSYRTSALRLLRRTPARPVVDWFLAEDWRTWVSHFLILLLVTLATGWWLIWASIVLVLIYLILEGFDSSRDRTRWIDHTMDWITAWGGFGAGFAALDGNWVLVGVIILFVLGMGCLGYVAKRRES